MDFVDLDFHLSICLYNRKQVFLILINFLHGSLITSNYNILLIIYNKGMNLIKN